MAHSTTMKPYPIIKNAVLPEKKTVRKDTPDKANPTVFTRGRRKVLPEGFWIMARIAFEKGGLSLRTISELMQVSYATCQGRSCAERWASPWKRDKEQREKTAALVIDLVARGETAEFRKVALSRLSPRAREESERAVRDGYNYRQREITLQDAEAMLKETLKHAKETPEFLEMERECKVGDVREVVIAGSPMRIRREEDGSWVYIEGELNRETLERFAHQQAPEATGKSVAPTEGTPTQITDGCVVNLPSVDTPTETPEDSGGVLPPVRFSGQEKDPDNMGTVGCMRPDNDETKGSVEPDNGETKGSGGTPSAEARGEISVKRGLSLKGRVDELLKGGTMGFGEKGERHKALMAEIAGMVMESLGEAVEERGGLSALEAAGDVEKWDKIARRNLDLEEKKGGMGVLGIVMMGSEECRPIPAPAIMGEVQKIEEPPPGETDVIEGEIVLMEDEAS